MRCEGGRCGGTGWRALQTVRGARPWITELNMGPGVASLGRCRSGRACVSGVYRGGCCSRLVVLYGCDGEICSLSIT
jgi:hypothetical protein